MHHNVKKQIKIRSDNGFRKRWKMCVCVFYFRTTWDLFKTFFLIKIFYIYLFLFAKYFWHFDPKTFPP